MRFLQWLGETQLFWPDFIMQSTCTKLRRVLVTALLTIFISLMATFFVLTVNQTGWFDLMILLVISFAALAALSCLYREPLTRAAVHAGPVGKFLWAVGTLEALEQRLEFRYIAANANQSSQQWARSPPVSIPSVEVVRHKTCLCCLDELQPRCPSCLQGAEGLVEV
ncbi:unnamed protein product [Symbiodinium natans]|uniref:Uncharacterized protein n=1 Tax=Symbiodinium natans TaxID=878477 RepID=A0A812IFA8_9DINO|nr:unnamed protein product [Symbiodinium natans]